MVSKNTKTEATATATTKNVAAKKTEGSVVAPTPVVAAAETEKKTKKGNHIFVFDLK